MPNGGWVIYFYDYYKITSTVGASFCSVYPSLCGDLVASISNADANLDNYERYDVLAGHSPAGTSLMNIRHWK